MVDISMCGNEKCPRRKNCYRFTAEPNQHWQTYGSFPAEGDSFDECEYFWNNKDHDNSGWNRGTFNYLYSSRRSKFR